MCLKGHNCLAGRACLVQLSQCADAIPARPQAPSLHKCARRPTLATAASITDQRPEAGHCQPQLQGWVERPAQAMSASGTAQQPEAVHCRPPDPSAMCPEQDTGSLLFHGTLCPSCKGLRQAPCSGCQGAGLLGRGGYSTKNPLDARRVQGDLAKATLQPPSVVHHTLSFCHSSALNAPCHAS